MKQRQEIHLGRESWRNKLSLNSLFPMRITFCHLPPPSIILSHLHVLNLGTSIRGPVWETRAKSHICIFVLKVGTSGDSLEKYTETMSSPHHNSLHSHPQLSKRDWNSFCPCQGQELESFTNNCLHSNYIIWTCILKCFKTDFPQRLKFGSFLNMWHLCVFRILNNREEPI